jgi:hypothetical protein
MKLDGAIFSIEQRSVGGCLDLAIVFLREHFVAVMQLVAIFAVPSVLLTRYLVAEHDWPTSVCLVLFFFEAPFCGAALIGAAGHRVFGDQFSARNGLKLLFHRLPLFGLLTLILRPLILGASFFMIFPAYLLATRYGFLAEVLLLEGCPAKRYETRLNDLLNQSFGGLVGRLFAIVSFFSITTLSLFVLIDLAVGTLLGLPVLVGRFSDLAYFVEEFTTLMLHDPRVSTVLVSVLWIVYPVIRLAWMFCYLDVRIRKEGWDLEIDFRVEARRLEGTV